MRQTLTRERATGVEPATSSSLMSTSVASSTTRKLAPLPIQPAISTRNAAGSPCCVAAVQQPIAPPRQRPATEEFHRAVRSPSRRTSDAAECSLMQPVADDPDLKRLLLYQLS